MASVINIAAVLVAVVVAVSVLSVPLYVLGEYEEDALERLRARVTRWRKTGSGRPDRARAGTGVGLALAIESRNRPSYGQRVMGIRRVDASTGGPVTPTSATIHYAISELIRALVPYESSAAKEQREERLRAVVPELVALWKKPSGNRAAVLRDSLALLHEHKANPFGPTGRTMGIRLAIHLVSVAVLPKRQSLPDLAAAIVTATSDQQRMTYGR